MASSQFSFAQVVPARSIFSPEDADIAMPYSTAIKNSQIAPDPLDFVRERTISLPVQDNTRFTPQRDRLKTYPIQDDIRRGQRWRKVRSLVKMLKVRYLTLR